MSTAIDGHSEARGVLRDAHKDKAIALHESAHAVVSVALNSVFERVTIIPDPEAEGCVVPLRTPDVSSWSDRRLRAWNRSQAIIHLAGPAFDMTFLCESPGGATDTENAAEHAILSTKDFNRRAAVRAYRECWWRACLLVGHHHDAIDKLGGALLDRRELTYAEARAIIAHELREPSNSVAACSRDRETLRLLEFQHGPAPIPPRLMSASRQRSSLTG